MSFDTWLALLSSGAIGGAIGGASLNLIVHGWITERLKQSIHHEYSQKLENHRAELNLRFQQFQNDNALRQLRTSLFFDHQRAAFASLAAKVSAVNDTWAEKHFDIDSGLDGPVPHAAYQELRDLYQQHQLFLDSECVTAMQLVFSCYTDSFPIHDGSGGPLIPRDVETSYARVQFLQPRIAELFRSKIGVTSESRALQEIGLLGAMRLINKYHFAEIDLPPKGPLKVAGWNMPSEIVSRAIQHLPELLDTLRRMRDFLRTESGAFPDASLAVESYLEILVARRHRDLGPLK